MNFHVVTSYGREIYSEISHLCNRFLETVKFSLKHLLNQQSHILEIYFCKPAKIIWSFRKSLVRSTFISYGYRRVN